MISNNKPASTSTEGKDNYPDRFWIYDSGDVAIDDERLYDYLYKKGYRYFLTKPEGVIFIVTVSNNQVSVLCEDRLWKICCQIVDKDFPSVPEKERTKIKAELKTCKGSLRKRRLVQFQAEDLAGIEDSASKRFLIEHSNEPNMGKGGIL